MKQILRKKENYRATYEKRCECCGKTFKASYPFRSYYSHREALDIVNTNYNLHKLICNSNI